MEPSPCKQVCRLDTDRVCVGCHRTIEEITAWINMTPAEKAEVLSRLFDVKIEERHVDHRVQLNQP